MGGFRGVGVGGVVSPAVNRTLVLCKPDAVERGLVGEIVSRLERKGLRIAALELRTIDRALAEQHYAELSDKPFFPDLIEFITRSPLVAIVAEGPADNTWHLVRTVMGKTSVDDAQPGSIRGDFATTTTENLVHGSDGPESAAREIALFFPGLA